MSQAAVCHEVKSVSKIRSIDASGVKNTSLKKEEMQKRSLDDICEMAGGDKGIKKRKEDSGRRQWDKDTLDAKVR